MARGFFFPFLVNYITSGSAVILIKQTIKKKTLQCWWSSINSDEIFVLVANYALTFRVFCAKASAKLLKIKYPSPVTPCLSLTTVKLWSIEFSISRALLCRNLSLSCLYLKFAGRNTLNNNNNNDNLFLIRRKLTSEYDQICLTTITASNNYNKVYLRIPKNL